MILVRPTEIPSTRRSTFASTRVTVLLWTLLRTDPHMRGLASQSGAQGQQLNLVRRRTLLLVCHKMSGNPVP
ncbi:hypothetical protein BV20DRAFT_197790 [Pilatotrama ljubarskyi]|nr:hypothetical protein BV20DRAFT_197790 [Pilatotrama ljubarskyi]